MSLENNPECGHVLSVHPKHILSVLSSYPMGHFKPDSDANESNTKDAVSSSRLIHNQSQVWICNQ